MSNVSEWESAYLRFESPEAEIRKFTRRLVAAGVGSWRKDEPVLEAFCGRGSGIHAWRRLGFLDVSGLDISEALLKQFQGNARCYVADARRMPLSDGSMKVISIQGGLHHLDLAELESVFSECARVLAPGGRLVLVEPWMTFFLATVHRVCSVSVARRIWPKLDALATMIDCEGELYMNWLRSGDRILGLLRSHFSVERLKISFGKMSCVAVRR